MATVGEQSKASNNSSAPWEDSKDCCLLPERKPRADNAVKHKKHGAVLSSSASAHELRCSDIEKEKEDNSSPRGVIEACMKSFGSNSGSSQCGTKESEDHTSSSRAISNWTKFFKLWKRRSLKRLASITPLPMSMLSKRKSRSVRENTALRDLYGFRSCLQNFSLSELETATNKFCKENLIGKGGYSEVYKGCLPDGKLVAVKKLTKGTSDEKTAGFLSELGIIAHVDHPNIAKLLGCGIDGGMHLVFELSPLGSLGNILYGSEQVPGLQVKLDWSKRYKIALGTADGLMYLHETCQKRIIHRDIKAENILLTEDFEPQICDFGLAKWLPKQWTHYNVSKFEGTFGYFAPEYFMHGIVDEKTDVYAFGVLLLELITGRRALDESQQNLVIWAKPLLDNNDIKELVDPSLGENYDIEEIDRVILTASLCIEQSPILRPRMNQVLILLRGDEYLLECAKEFQKQAAHRTYSEELWHVKEYNLTKHLNDINRLKEIAFGS